jgi:hypothetical protein
MSYTDPVYILQAASGDQTVARTSDEIDSRLSSATVRIDITKLTLADADDEVDFYVQTSYDGGASWVDCQNFHFTTDDNGSTALVEALIDGAVHGPGTTKSIIGTDPAAGSEISETVPANAIWKWIAGLGTLVTDATVADRRVHVTLDNGTSPWWEGVSSSIQAASLTNKYNIGAPVAAVIDTAHFIALPIDTYLKGGDRIITVTDLLKAGDNWGAPQFRVEEWHDPDVLTDGTIRDNVKSYNRPLGTHVRIKTAVTGATAPVYAYSATVFFR